METGIPRRNILNENTVTELAINKAIQKVEELGADVRLTQAIILMSQAKDLVSDFDDQRLKG